MPSKTNSLSRAFLFPEKEAKSVSSSSQKTTLFPNLGEADPGILRACHQRPIHLVELFFFQRKKQKA
jgi:hypothetical protein